jgi:hypothetical protein
LGSEQTAPITETSENRKVRHNTLLNQKGKMAGSEENAANPGESSTPLEPFDEQRQNES